MEWEIVDEHIPTTPLPKRKKEYLGFKDKAMLEFFRDSNNPAAEVFLF